MYLGDIEVFRTSTAEPTATGIVWSYVKDMSGLLPLFKESQKIIFDLPNIVDQTYTGYLNTTLTATFFKQENIPQAADVILPVSARQSAENKPSVFQVPDQTASNKFSVPKNVKKAFFTIASCGQQTEEFWYTNVLSSTVATFPDTTLYGFSPWREVQLLIDGSLAGVAWPFPVIFTGGIVPGFWRPIVGIDAFDLKEDEIDITPWLPLLVDGEEHEFTIRVVGIGDDGALSPIVGEYWLVTGKIFLWLDEHSIATTGSVTTYQAPNPIFSVESSTKRDNDGTNTTLTYSVQAQRSLQVTSTIKTSSGSEQVSWAQSLNLINNGTLTDGGNTQISSQITTATDLSSDGYSRSYSYPIRVYSTFTDDTASGGNLTIDGKIDHAKNFHVHGRGAFFTPVDALPPVGRSSSPPHHTAYSVVNEQQANATFTENAANNASSSTGRTAQHYVLKGENGSNSYGGQENALLYGRTVVAQNAVVVEDTTSGTASSEGYGAPADQGPGGDAFVVQAYPPTRNIESMIGRAPVGF